MAQTGYTPIQLYYSSTASAAPLSANLLAGELAINTVDEKLFFKNSAGTVKVIASTAAPSLTVGSTVVSSGTSGYLLYNNAGILGNLATTGSGNVVLATSPTLVTPVLGTPSSGTLTSCTGLPLSTGVTGTLAIANGGTGQTTSSAAFNALSPMTTAGDIIYGGVSGAGTRLGIGSTNQVLTVVAGAPAWVSPAAGGVTSITGTSNQIIASASTGAVTLSTPQSIGTASSVQFGSFGVGTAASGTTGEIRATNNVTAYYSDDRFKTNLGNIPDALAKVLTLNGFYYEANELAQSYGYEKKMEVGVSAQQVQAIMPEVVAPAPIDENYLTVRYERLVPLLIEAIKELKAQIDVLKGK